MNRESINEVSGGGFGVSGKLGKRPSARELGDLGCHAEDRMDLAVVVEDDPGKDPGIMRQPGHRFVYGFDEVEPLKEVGV